MNLRCAIVCILLCARCVNADENPPDTAIASGLAAVGRLDAIVPNQLLGNPGTLANWEHERRVDWSARRRRSRTAATPAPAPQPVADPAEPQPVSAPDAAAPASPEPAAPALEMAS